VRTIVSRYVPAWLQLGHRPGPSTSRSQNTTVTWSSRAASVIVTPCSIVRMIVSATIEAGRQVGSDTGLPGVDDDSV